MTKLWEWGLRIPALLVVASVLISPAAGRTPPDWVVSPLFTLELTAAVRSLEVGGARTAGAGFVATGEDGGSQILETAVETQFCTPQVRTCDTIGCAPDKPTCLATHECSQAQSTCNTVGCGMWPTCMQTHACTPAINTCNTIGCTPGLQTCEETVQCTPNNPTCIATIGCTPGQPTCMAGCQGPAAVTLPRTPELPRRIRLDLAKWVDGPSREVF
jgi:hypothetical protein